MFRDRQQPARPVPLNWLLGAVQCAGEQEDLQSRCRPPLGPAVEQGLQQPGPLRRPGVLAPPVARLIDKDNHCWSYPACLAAATFRVGYSVLSAWAGAESPCTNSKAGRSLPVIAESRSIARIASSRRPRSLRSSTIIAVTFILHLSEVRRRNLFPNFKWRSVRQQQLYNILDLAWRSCLQGRCLVDNVNPKADTIANQIGIPQSEKELPGGQSEIHSGP